MLCVSVCVRLWVCVCVCRSKEKKKKKKKEEGEGDGEGEGEQPDSQDSQKTEVREGERVYNIQIGSVCIIELYTLCVECCLVSLEGAQNCYSTPLIL